MANYNFLNLLKPVNKPGKSGFDLSQKHVFSTKVGQAVPCMALETVPGDHHEINLSSLNRTMALNTPAFLRGKFKYDFFFVPYVQLWHPFEQFITQREDKHSSLQKSFANCPVMNLKVVLTFIGQIYKFNKTQNLNIYGSFEKEDFPHGAVRLLDMLGYGLYDQMFDIIDDDIANSTSNFNDWTDLYSDYHFNFWRLAAYQHIWYDYYRNKFYDNEATYVLNGSTVTFDYVEMFNFDDLDCGTFANSILNPAMAFNLGDINDPMNVRVANLLTLRHIQWKKDIFTSALPGTQFGSVSSISVTSVSDRLSSYNSTNIGNNLLFGSTTGSLRRGELVEGTPNTLGNTKATSLVGSASFDVLALKRAEALQQWKQNTLRAGNMTDDSFKAHYGVDPYYYQDNNVRYLGSYEAMLQINAVNATATTSENVNGKVAEQGATGTAVSKGDTIRFDTNDFGVVLCISSFLPEAEYNAVMLDKANRLYEQFDYFTPEFQNIGLETIQASDYNINAYARAANFIMGYVNRYSVYKTAVDKVHGQFATNLYDTGLTGVHFTKSTGSLSAWVTPRNESMTLPLGGATPSRKVNSWYVDVNVLDNVLGIASDETEDTDSLLHNVYFDVKSIRPMSVLGLPQF